MKTKIVFAAAIVALTLTGCNGIPKRGIVGGVYCDGPLAGRICPCDRERDGQPGHYELRMSEASSECVWVAH